MTFKNIISSDECSFNADELVETINDKREFIKRPKDTVNLIRLCGDDRLVPRSKFDPTDDLREVSVGHSFETFRMLVGAGYCIWCEDSLQFWYAHSLECLNQNFIYRDDLVIKEFDSAKNAFRFYEECFQNRKIMRTQHCYIIDFPGAEKYEVYYDPEYPLSKYGKSAPVGGVVHKYENRFHRDMAILALENLYNSSSKKSASERIKKRLAGNEALIISDGSLKGNFCSNAFWYVDDDTTVQFSEGHVPSDPDKGGIISEIVGVTNALTWCEIRKKTKLKVYYDSNAIIAAFTSKKLSEVKEVRQYVNLAKRLDAEGYDIDFIELHPKTGKDRDTINPALLFFHNSCDEACRRMNDVFIKEYQKLVIKDNKSGKNVKQVTKVNNKKNGNNKYGRRF